MCIHCGNPNCRPMQIHILDGAGLRDYLASLKITTPEGAPETPELDRHGRKIIARNDGAMVVELPIGSPQRFVITEKTGTFCFIDRTGVWEETFQTYKLDHAMKLLPHAAREQMPKATPAKMIDWQDGDFWTRMKDNPSTIFHNRGPNARALHGTDHKWFERCEPMHARVDDSEALNWAIKLGWSRCKHKWIDGGYCQFCSTKFPAKVATATIDDRFRELRNFANAIDDTVHNIQRPQIEDLIKRVTALESREAQIGGMLAATYVQQCDNRFDAMNQRLKDREKDVLNLTTQVNDLATKLDTVDKNYRELSQQLLNLNREVVTRK